MQKQKGGRELKMDALNILRRAKKALETKGWTRGALSAHGRLCSLGAINYAVTGTALSGGERVGAQSAVDYLGQAIKAKHGYHSVIGFNDSVAKKKSQVIDVFTDAIRRARAEAKVKKENG